MYIFVLVCLFQLLYLFNPSPTTTVIFSVESHLYSSNCHRQQHLIGIFCLFPTQALFVCFLSMSILSLFSCRIILYLLHIPCHSTLFITEIDSLFYWFFFIFFSLIVTIFVSWTFFSSDFGFSHILFCVFFRFCYFPLFSFCLQKQFFLFLSFLSDSIQNVHIEYLLSLAKLLFLVYVIRRKL